MAPLSFLGTATLALAVATAWAMAGEPAVAAKPRGAAVRGADGPAPRKTTPDAPLSARDALPHVQGKTLSGVDLVLPEPGRAAVFVFGFSKEAATSMSPWLSACRSQDPSVEPAWRCYDVRMVEGIPGLFRGFIERAMRKEYPAEWRDDALLVYRDNEVWKRRLGVSDPKVAQVLVADAEGRVAAMAAGAWSEERLQSLLATLRD